MTHMDNNLINFPNIVIIAKVLITIYNMYIPCPGHQHPRQ